MGRSGRWEETARVVGNVGGRRTADGGDEDDPEATAF